MEAWRERSRFWSDAFGAKEKDLRAESGDMDLLEITRRAAVYADEMTRARFGSTVEETRW